ncbi:hypothetical protein D1AOALGA4SA_6355 [Olavius algarvensis Delta 1 endosymbiont]|nr:hypothetical protein D1AOALGA4SA_6355 [Olavius algarvensis Delta 1 endosymbiont]
MSGDRRSVFSDQYSVIRILKSESCIQYPASSIQHQVSSIQHQVSSIQHQASSIRYPASSIKYPASSIKYPASASGRTITILRSCLQTRWSPVDPRR